MIIRNESVMSSFLKFLIFSLETLDGSRGSANKIIELKKKNLLLEEGKLRRELYGATCGDRPLSDA